jgi:actinorhodin biosynthesis protein ActVIA
MSRILPTLVLVIAITTASLHAQSSQASSTLSALDYIQIEQLVAKYARAIDTCSNNGYDYADLFTADGVFASEQDGKAVDRARGREKLAEVSGGGSRGCKNVGWIQQGVKHIYTNHIITPSAEGATGTVDMLMIGLGSDPYRIRHEGYYEDTYVRTPQGWRFKSRLHHVPSRPAAATAAPSGGSNAAPVQPR